MGRRGGSEGAHVSESSTPPEQVEIRAIDVVPCEAAIWCTVGDSNKPFANPIEHRAWSDDGQHIWFMLGTHNFYKAAPDDMVKVVQLPRTERREHKSLFEPVVGLQFDNEAFLRARPKHKVACASCGGTGVAK